jgi:superfamily II RNA helicase
MRRLDELIRQLAESSQVIGNFNLKEKLDKASTLIKRGIVFAASLYLSD